MTATRPPSVVVDDAPMTGHEVQVVPVVGDDDIARVTLWCRICRVDLIEPMLYADPSALLRDVERHQREVSQSAASRPAADVGE